MAVPNVGPATVNLSLACGELVVTTIDGSAGELRTRDLGGRSATVDEGPQSLDIRSDVDRWGAGFGSHGDDWQLALHTDVGIDLDAEINAGRGRFDLAGATIGTLAVAVTERVLLTSIGTETLSTVLTLGNWTDYNGQADPTAFAAAAANVVRWGVSFGGGCHYANCVGTPTGSAVFTFTP